MNYLDSATWPIGRDTMRRHVLQTTNLDEEITSNKGNELVVMDSLRSALQRLYPDLLDCRDAESR